MAELWSHLASPGGDVDSDSDSDADLVIFQGANETTAAETIDNVTAPGPSAEPVSLTIRPSPSQPPSEQPTSNNRPEAVDPCYDLKRATNLATEEWKLGYPVPEIQQLPTCKKQDKFVVATESKLTDTELAVLVEKWAKTYKTRPKYARLLKGDDIQDNKTLFKEASDDYLTDQLAAPWSEEQDDAVDEKLLGTFVQRFTHIRCLSLDIDHTKMKRIPSKGFGLTDRGNILTDEHRKIHTALKAMFDNLSEGARQRDGPHLWQLVIKGVDLPENPISGSTVFTSNEHRTVALIGSVVEEAEMLRERVTNLFNKTLKAVILQDSFAAWKPEPTEKYGIVADGAPLRQTLMVLCDDVGDVLPDIDTRCTFYMPKHYPQRKAPDDGMAESAIDMTLVRPASEPATRRMILLTLVWPASEPATRRMVLLTLARLASEPASRRRVVNTRRMSSPADGDGPMKWASFLLF
ncbi:hypothetical protein G7Z17_g7734 [Cylindrodendrum hubeiense]|uniref:Uncharacterized protein n=1 Tax=Cylindrodendrum hubeiense TaxID=595255 RepID=A0A9P5H515_9HYPO|nr:hypothetical protein G7Z17_g7734 [Cylindrodendrum hubeiense]